MYQIISSLLLFDVLKSKSEVHTVTYYINSSPYCTRKKQRSRLFSYEGRGSIMGDFPCTLKILLDTSRQIHDVTNFNTNEV